MCGKLISYEDKSENLDTAADLSKFEIFAHSSMAQSSSLHSLALMLLKISLAIQLDGK